MNETPWSISSYTHIFLVVGMHSSWEHSRATLVNQVLLGIFLFLKREEKPSFEYEISWLAQKLFKMICGQTKCWDPGDYF